MKNWFFIIFTFLLASCSELIDPPKNLIEKDKMSEIIAEFAINDQMSNFFPQTNIENLTRFTLKQKNITATDFVESYKFYTRQEIWKKSSTMHKKLFWKKILQRKIILKRN
ncbi:DUF4296 domain-containing protein [Kaistella anthropi]|nr:DUF4296 domain-containing protein [Kaistella anthropi]